MSSEDAAKAIADQLEQFSRVLAEHFYATGEKPIKITLPKDMWYPMKAAIDKRMEALTRYESSSRIKREAESPYNIEINTSFARFIIELDEKIIHPTAHEIDLKFKPRSWGSYVHEEPPKEEKKENILEELKKI